MLRKAAVISIGLLIAMLTLPTFGAAASASPETQSAPSIPSYSSTTEGSYSNEQLATHISATLVVPYIFCKGNPAGQTAGQAYGVDLYGTYSSSPTLVFDRELADVRTYCEGSEPFYDTEFIVNDVTNGTAIFEPAEVPVRPGDLVHLDLWATPAGSHMSITNLDSGRSASVSGPGYSANQGFDAFMTGIASNGDGQILSTGTESDATGGPILAGPVPSLPTLFLNVQVDGQPLAKAPGLFIFNWVSASNTALATITPIFCGSDFSILVNP